MKTSRPPLGLTQPPIQWMRGPPSPVASLPRTAAVHSPQSSAQNNNERSYTSVSPDVFTTCTGTLLLRVQQARLASKSMHSVTVLPRSLGHCLNICSVMLSLHSLTFLQWFFHCLTENILTADLSLPLLTSAASVV